MEMGVKLAGDLEDDPPRDQNDEVKLWFVEIPEINRSVFMTKHMPDAPAANRSNKGPGDTHEAANDTTPAKHPDALNTSEQGHTANIKQNTTNEGFFRGRRTK